jgi:hypothetical protein
MSGREFLKKFPGGTKPIVLRAQAVPEELAGRAFGRWLGDKFLACGLWT